MPNKTLLSLCLLASPLAFSYQIKDVQAQTLFRLMLSGGVPVKKTSSSENPLLVKLEVNPGNISCWGSRSFFTDNSEEIDVYPLLYITNACYYNSPEQIHLPDSGGIPELGTHLTSDPSDLLRELKEGLLSEVWLGKWLIGVANLKCNVLFDGLGNKNFTCDYSAYSNFKQ